MPIQQLVIVHSVVTVPCFLHVDPASPHYCTLVQAREACMSRRYRYRYQVLRQPGVASRHDFVVRVREQHAGCGERGSWHPPTGTNHKHYSASDLKVKEKPHTHEQDHPWYHAIWKATNRFSYPVHVAFYFNSNYKSMIPSIQPRYYHRLNKSARE